MYSTEFAWDQMCDCLTFSRSTRCFIFHGNLLIKFLQQQEGTGFLSCNIQTFVRNKIKSPG